MEQSDHKVRKEILVQMVNQVKKDDQVNEDQLGSLDGSHR
uniref:Transcriptional regulator n=1 Tax=Elaeophora elaphi TaxID=1147741 RepID=A0A0R3RWK3_9BILA